jgi:hypothetical protein
VATAPAGLTLEHHRDLEGREKRPWSRRILLAAVALFCLAGVLNGFGQARYVETVQGNGAELEVEAPARVRGGIYYEVRIEIRAERELRDAIVVLGSGWFEGITVNTVEPGPIGEASRNGDVSFDLGHVPAGQKHVLWLQNQVNPTTVARREVTVELYDGEALLAELEKTLTVLP